MEIPKLNSLEKEFSDKINFEFIKGDPTDEDGKFCDEKFPYIILGPKYDNYFKYKIEIYRGGTGAFGLGEKLDIKEIDFKKLDSIIKYLVGNYSYYNEKLSGKNINLLKEGKIKVYYSSDEWLSLINPLKKLQKNI